MRNKVYIIKTNPPYPPPLVLCSWHTPCTLGLTLGRYKKPPHGTPWLKVEDEYFRAIINGEVTFNGKNFPAALNNATMLAPGTWPWVHELMAKNTAWTWARSTKALQRYYHKKGDEEEGESESEESAESGESEDSKPKKKRHRY